MPRTHLSSVEALMMRAARAHEDPREMTRHAFNARMQKIESDLKAKNPDLKGGDLAKACRLVLRAQMAELAKRSAAVRASRSS